MLAINKQYNILKLVLTLTQLSIMTTFQEFMDSLSPDLNPEEKADQIAEFAKKRDEEYVTLQSASQKGVNDLKARTETMLQEAKKVSQNENYILELHAKDPEMAETIIKTFGKPWLTIEDIKGGQKMGTTPNFEDQMAEYNKKKESDDYMNQFVSSIGFTEDEKKAFDDQLKSLTGWRVLPKNELKVIMTGIAFSMNKNISNNKDGIIAANNVVPQGSGGWARVDAKEYKPHDNSTAAFMEQAWIIKKAPAK